MVELAAAACAVVIWLYLVLFRGMFWRLREGDALPAPAPRRVAIVIPARNEAQTIGRTIASLAAQKLGVTASDCIVVEDSEVGIEAAQAAGMKAMRFYNNAPSQ